MFWMFVIISSFIIAGYAGILLIVLTGWKRLPAWQIPAGWSPVTSISVVIAARNEIENIGACLHSILQQNYPAGLFEIIVVDDHSDDGTAAFVENLSHPQVRLFKLADFSKNVENQAFKKQALTLGIAHARGQLIVTTDADCLASSDWLRQIASFYETTSSKFIAAPVLFYEEKTTFEKFQSLDLLGMMGVTAAGIFWEKIYLGNGANMAFEKAVFDEVGGYEGTTQLSSGDDLLLLAKVRHRYPHGVVFLKNKEAVIVTKAAPDLNSFIQQRLRWATKTVTQPNIAPLVVQGWVFLTCWSIILSGILSPFFGWKMLLLFVFLFLTKAVFDLIFLQNLSRFFRKENLLTSFLPAFLLNLFYFAGIGLASLFLKKYVWKGRRTE